MLGTYVIGDRKGEEIVWTFYENKLQKQIKKSLGFPKAAISRIEATLCQVATLWQRSFISVRPTCPCVYSTKHP